MHDVYLSKLTTDLERGGETAVRRVARAVVERDEMGTVAEPKAYISGSVEMGWGVVTGGAAYWSCALPNGDGTQTMLGLIGPQRNIIGGPCHGQFVSPPEIFAETAGTLIDCLDDPYADFSPDASFGTWSRRNTGDFSAPKPKPTWAYMKSAASFYIGERITYAFAARVIYSAAVHEQVNRYILALPLYVAVERLRSEDIEIIDGRRILRISAGRFAEFKTLERPAHHPKSTLAFAISMALQNAGMIDEVRAFNSRAHHWLDDAAFQAVLDDYILIAD